MLFCIPLERGLGVLFPQIWQQDVLLELVHVPFQTFKSVNGWKVSTYDKAIKVYTMNYINTQKTLSYHLSLLSHLQSNCMMNIVVICPSVSFFFQKRCLKRIFIFVKNKIYQQGQATLSEEHTLSKKCCVGSIVFFFNILLTFTLPSKNFIFTDTKWILVLYNTIPPC